MKNKVFLGSVFLVEILICCIHIQVTASEELISEIDSCDAEDTAITDFFDLISQTMDAKISDILDKQIREIKEQAEKTHDSLERDQAYLLGRLEGSMKSNVMDYFAKLDTKFDLLETKYDKLQSKLDMQLEQNWEQLIEKINEEIGNRPEFGEQQKRIEKLENQEKFFFKMQQSLNVIEQTRKQNENTEAMCQSIEEIRTQKPDEQYEKLLSKIEEQQREIDLMKQTSVDMELEFKKEIKNQLQQIDQKDQEIEEVKVTFKDVVNNCHEDNEKQHKELHDQQQKITDLELKLEGLQEYYDKQNEHHQKLLPNTEEQQREIDLMKQRSVDMESKCEEENKKHLQQIEQNNQEMGKMKETFKDVNKKIVKKLKYTELKFKELQENFDKQRENHLKDTAMLKDQSNANEIICQKQILEWLINGKEVVIQSRIDGSVEFNRTWHEYQIGFGNSSGEFFIGLETIHKLTQTRSYTLRIDMEDWEQNLRYAEYDEFVVESENENYTLKSLGTYSGNAGDSFEYHLGANFSTKDRDNDEWSEGSCSLEEGGDGGWWFSRCGDSNLNGPYKTEEGNKRGVEWRHFTNSNYYSLKFAKMTLRPN